MEMKDIRAKAEAKKCPLQRTIVFVDEFLKELMCGECFPCSLGSHELEVRLRQIARGVGTQSDFETVDKVTRYMLELSRCRKGIDTARFIAETMKEVSFKQHLEGICTEKECLGLITYWIIPEKCRMCGTCQDTCKDNAIIGERKKPFSPSYLPFHIVQSRCRSGCHECIKVCPTKAITVVDTLLPNEKETLSRISRELEELLHMKSEVEGLGYLPFEIIQNRCTRCDECLKVCPSGAIEVESLGGYLPFEIIEKRCTRCGKCLKVCPSGAIEAGYKNQLTVKV